MIHEINGVSVIICYHNNAGRIGDTLDHLVAQQVPTDVLWEIFLADTVWYFRSWVGRLPSRDHEYTSPPPFPPVNPHRRINLACYLAMIQPEHLAGAARVHHHVVEVKE